MVFTKTCELTDYNRREIMRYAGVSGSEHGLDGELDRCLALCEGVFRGAVCYSRTAISVGDNCVETPFGRLESRALAKNLSGCDEAVFFAATVGAGIDRLIRRYSAADITTAVWLQAIGAERVESLCRVFCGELDRQLSLEKRYTRPRFSPGYGDLPLEAQRGLTEFLDCRRKIGVTLNESLLMTPGKSVTAIVGVGREKCTGRGGGCAFCDKTDCAYADRDKN